MTVFKSHYRWVIVAAGGVLGCLAMGAMFSLPVFLRPISRATGWSITGVSSAMTFGFIAMALGSITWGSLSDRFGPRVIVVTGSGILAASLALASRATSLIEFQIVFGLLVGGATAAIFARGTGDRSPLPVALSYRVKTYLPELAGCGCCKCGLSVYLYS